LPSKRLSSIPLVSRRQRDLVLLQLGTMQAQEEIDALITFGIPPVEFLVLPRMVALSLMMPLLYLYACLVGLAGGLIVGTAMLSLTVTQYALETQAALSLTEINLLFPWPHSHR
jgi:phospholipid/cholesterol/gamma-HCH transport system permease protein